MANTTRIKDLSAVTSVADTDVLPVDGANGTKGVTFGNLSTAVLNKLTSKTYGLDQGTKSLPVALKAARIATSVFPNPTSPHTKRSIGRSLSISALASWVAFN